MTKVHTHLSTDIIYGNLLVYCLSNRKYYCHMKITPTEAIRMAGVSRQKLYNDMDNGKLSFEKQGPRKRLIDISELVRVYPSAKLEREEKTSNDVKDGHDRTQLDEGGIAVELALLPERAESLAIERERERRQFESEIDHLRDRLAATDSERIKLTAIITDQRSQDQKRQDAKAQQRDELSCLQKTVADLTKQNRAILHQLHDRRGLLARLLGSKPAKGQAHLRSHRGANRAIDNSRLHP